MQVPPDPELRDSFIGAMSHAAATVNIITTDGAAGRAGVTVSAMSSVSADTPKPTLLVCVHHRSAAAQKIIDNGVFCVNVLKDDQSYISDSFAGRFSDVLNDKFDCTDWAAMPSGAPRVVDPLVGFDCRVASSERVGTHHVFIGEVNDIFIADQGSPLIYARRAYGTATRIDAAASIAAGRAAADTTLAVGCFHTFGPYILPEMIQRMTSAEPGLRIELVEGDQRRVQESLLAGETEVGLLYDIGISPELDTLVLTRLKPYVLLAEGHALAEKSELAPRDLAGQPMVLLDMPPSRDFARKILESAGITPDIAYRSTSFEMVRGLVGHGLGFTILATRPATDMTYDGRALVTRPLASDAAPSRVVLATRKRGTLGRPAQQFLRFCREFFDLDD
ncbi:MAG: flavin reductase, partial [Rhodobacter sp.]|nr:flavin reductase [Rhodobacter sp.]